ncbi:Bgt-1868 [Blumeria graminis f. sp. tritici]|uniref:SWR1-complex protein 5 n=2 Tax=Blumeria graminis f. sp. tritici TaxID=62690 RepID=A0A061HLZ4_BLUGR|nr:SWR1-complex protein [Blumeria graminis f. sp. tritici 96224]VDB87767.1 Bgt-1868 [Blumeria graminis f. sp. tritici]
MEDEDYNSSEDSDFLPQTHPQISGEVYSDDESEPDEVSAKGLGRKRIHLAKEEVVSDCNASGDEVVIALSKKNITEGQMKKNKSIMTRSMRALEGKKEKEPKNPLVSNSATIDVEAVWQAMLSGKPLPSTSNETNEQHNSFLPPPSSSCIKSKHGETLEGMYIKMRPKNYVPSLPSNSILVARQINEVVDKYDLKPQPPPVNSSESELQSEANSKLSMTTVTSSDSKVSFKRPPRLARRSRFEPINENLHPRDDLHLSIGKRSHQIERNIPEPLKKLNTVEKSAIDWSNFVDKEGISEELHAAGKSKGAYKARQEFLARVEQKKEKASRKARGLPT